ncbi:hypothetical protein ACFQZF_11560 [Flavobacterium myungsuense]|uniref:hypothetical protein n=1 Tax=Flavobacterium myungsuense TaxID=651823 RepID=UPI0036319638
MCSPATINITLAAVTAGSTGGGVLSYWTNATATTPLATPTAIATSGTYYIKSSSGICSDIKPVTVTVTTTPVLSITNPAEVCSPATINITLPAVTAGSTGGGTLTYWTNATATTALATPTAIATSGTYYIKSTSGICSDIKPVTITVTTTPVLSITNPAVVCSPATVDITLPSVTSGSIGGGVLTYWTNATATTALATPTAIATSGTYYIKSVSSICSDIKPVVVTINPAQVLNITNPGEVCSPSTVDITLPAVTAGSTGGGTLTYWTNATATTALATPTAIATSGTYYIKSTLGICSDIKPVTVTVTTTPVVNITNPAVVCSPASVDITLPSVTSGSIGGGVLTYWTNATATTALATPTAIATSGTYYIKSVSSICSDIKPVVVTINPAQVLNITNPGEVCSPATINITLPAVTAGSTGGGTLTYWTNATATTALATPTAIATSGTYYIKSTLGICSDIKPVTVTVTTTPVVNITNPAVVCSPASVDITLPSVTSGSIGGGVLTYWTNATATTALATPTAIATSGTYYIKSVSSICSDIKPVVVTINPAQVLNITNPGEVCSPATINITLPAVTAGSTGGGTLTYWTNATATTALATPTAIATSGTYYIKSTLGICSDIKPVTVTVTTTPVVNITNPAVVCSPASVDITLAAVTAGSIGGGVLTYWTNATATTALATPTAIATSGTYYIKSVSSICSDIKPVVVTINPAQVLSITNPGEVCSPSTVDITLPAVTAGSTGGGTLTYWTNATATTALATPTAIATSGTYYIKSTLGICSDIKPVTVTVTTTPVVNITNPAVVCSPASVDITLPSVTSGSIGGGVLTYWTNATATTALATPTAIATSGTYYIKSVSSICSDIKPVTVTVTTTPVLSITNPAEVCSPATINITLPAVTAGSTGGGTLTYWTNATATTALATPTAIATSGTYYIKSTSGICSDIKPVTITVTTTPVLSITNPAVVCSPATVDITLPSVTSGSIGGGVLTYWTNATATTALATPTAIATSGTYYIKSVSSICSDIKPVVVTINPAQVLNITNPGEVCSPSTVDITLPAVTAGSTGGGTLTYWTNATATTALATPTAIATSGTYYIKSTSGICSDIKPVTVTVTTTPVLSITNPAEVCSPATVNITLAAVTAGSIGGGILSYWSDAAATTALTTPTAITTSGSITLKVSLVFVRILNLW